jgi:hypothetical protein
MGKGQMDGELVGESSYCCWGREVLVLVRLRKLKELKEEEEEEEEEVASTEGGLSVSHAQANGQMSGKWADEGETRWRELELSLLCCRGREVLVRVMVERVERVGRGRRGRSCSPSRWMVLLRGFCEHCNRDSHV